MLIILYDILLGYTLLVVSMRERRISQKTCKARPLFSIKVVQAPIYYFFFGIGRVAKWLHPVPTQPAL